MFLIIEASPLYSFSFLQSSAADVKRSLSMCDYVQSSTNFFQCCLFIRGQKLTLLTVQTSTLMPSKHENNPLGFEKIKPYLNRARSYQCHTPACWDFHMKGFQDPVFRAEERTFQPTKPTPNAWFTAIRTGRKLPSSQTRTETVATGILNLKKEKTISVLAALNQIIEDTDHVL